jgi:WD40 repeat protein
LQCQKYRQFDKNTNSRKRNYKNTHWPQEKHLRRQSFSEWKVCCYGQWPQGNHLRCQLSQNGKYVATASQDDTMNVWKQLLPSFCLLSRGTVLPTHAYEYAWQVRHRPMKFWKAKVNILDSADGMFRLWTSAAARQGGGKWMEL